MKLGFCTISKSLTQGIPQSLIEYGLYTKINILDHRYFRVHYEAQWDVHSIAFHCFSSRRTVTYDKIASSSLRGTDNFKYLGHTHELGQARVVVICESKCGYLIWAFNNGRLSLFLFLKKIYTNRTHLQAHKFGLGGVGSDSRLQVSRGRASLRPPKILAPIRSPS